jgi:cysteinyl-tRNA synthetase, unknown class
MPLRSAPVMKRLLCLVIVLISCAVGCSFLLAEPEPSQSPRDAMRALVAEIADYTKSVLPGFLVIAQNGDELLTIGTTATAPLANDYIYAIDGLGREDLFYGYGDDNESTPVEATDWMLSFLSRAEALGIEVLVIDYCWDVALMDDSYALNAVHGFVSLAAPRRELDVIPAYPEHLAGENAEDVRNLANVRNFLYLINPWQFDTKDSFLAALVTTTYDALIVDLDVEDESLTAADVELLKTKANGGARLVLCYLSIGEAEDYRSYWDPTWTANPPEWLLVENPNWAGNYPVQFWHPDWQAIVFAMMDSVLAAGFDGVYLDRVDVYEEFEN